MPERLYIPAAYVDEVVPPGRASPDLWIGAPAGNAWLLATEQGFDLGITLKPGEAVAFSWVEHLGSAEIEILDDCAFTAVGTVPPGVTHFWFMGDPLTVTFSLAEFVAQCRRDGLVSDVDRRVEVTMARWSDPDELFTFEVGERGPRFIRPAPASAGGQA